MHATGTYGGMVIPLFAMWLESRRDLLTSGERAPVVHSIGGWLDPRTSLDALVVKNLLPLARMKP